MTSRSITSVICITFTVMATLSSTATGQSQRTVNQSARLVPKNPRQAGNFGTNVAIQDDTAVVGARTATGADRVTPTGAAYIFRRLNGVWLQEAKIVPDDGQAGDSFGEDVAIDGKTVIVGATHESSDNLGAAYVYERTDRGWVQRAKLVAEDEIPLDTFASVVALRHNIALVSAPNALGNIGAVYVFARRRDAWKLETKLVPTDQIPGGLFGSGTDLNEKTIVIGAPGFAGSGPGAAYVFRRRNADHWVASTKLMSNDTRLGDQFGSSVALQENTLMVGASSANTPVALFAGAAYVFEQQGEQWTQEAKLFANDGQINARFGAKIVISSDSAVIGSEDIFSLDPPPGSAYVFHTDGKRWTQKMKLRATDTTPGDGFGCYLGLSKNVLLVGAEFATPTDSSVAGEAYIFNLPFSKYKDHAR